MRVSPGIGFLQFWGSQGAVGLAVLLAPPFSLPMLHMAVQEPLAGGLSPLPGVQTTTAPWLVFRGALWQQVP